MTEETNQEQGSQPPNASLPATQQLLAASRAELGRVIAGQSEVIGEVLVAVLTQGHALLEGVPGIAKTLIVKSVGRLLGLGFQRVQGTPDLMPADILGTTMFRPGTDYVHFSRRSGLHRSAARGRDQSHAAAHAGSAARMHGRAAGDERRRAAPAARPGSPSSPRKIPSTLKAPIRCPRRSSTAFCSRSK